MVTTTVAAKVVGTAKAMAGATGTTDRPH
jgi:hypothetical protein